MTHSTHASSDAVDDTESVGHVVPLSTLTSVFVALLVLTVLTLLAARVQLGSLNLLVAVGIATVKASLVVLYFMHLRYDNPFYALIFVTGLLFLALFLGGSLVDTLQYQPDIESYRQSQTM